MTTGSTLSLLPPPMELSLGHSSGSASSLPVCTANLMPFSIDYDGPAPIDSFLVLRRADPVPSSEQSPGAVQAEQEPRRESSFVSAFRGRTMQSSQLKLPVGFEAKLIRVEQIAPASSSSRNTSSEPNDTEEEAAREKEAEWKQKRRRVERSQPVAMKQQRFSMDSDDDDDDDEEKDGDAGELASSATLEPESSQEAARNQQAVPLTDTTPAQAARGPSVRISTLAHVADNELRVWGPDGPTDKGDDTFFRTLGEWYSIVAPLVSALCSPFRALSDPAVPLGTDKASTLCPWPCLYRRCLDIQLHA